MIGGRYVRDRWAICDRQVGDWWAIGGNRWLIGGR